MHMTAILLQSLFFGWQLGTTVCLYLGFV
jgi:hypothetical protein